MKFEYEYRSRDNVRHTGTIVASDREAAFAALKATGIRPGSVREAPGFFNKLFGKGKRWLAIGVLVALSGVLAGGVLHFRARSAAVVRLEPAPELSEDRAQLYGDPAVISHCVRCGWTNVFAEAGDRFLVRYAIPGRSVARLERADIERAAAMLGSTQLVAVSERDYAEVAQMKRMVNGIKLELSEYLRDGGTAAGFVRRLERRQCEELEFYERVRNELLRGHRTADEWEERNASLRVLGLPMVEYVGE